MLLSIGFKIAGTHYGLPQHLHNASGIVDEAST